MSRYHFVPMTPVCAQQITGWRYAPPFGFYDLQPGDEDMLLAPELRYHAALDRDGGLAGFACFGEDAQVVGGKYAVDALDIGFGLAPERTGRGEGTGFVQAVCGHAWRALEAETLRLSVATFNRRAITVYRRAGFHTVDWFVGSTRFGSASFVAMTRERASGQTGRLLAI